MDANNVSAIISAVAGLVGVTTGAILNFLRDWFAERKRDKKNATYLAIIVGSELDRFIDECLAVAHDDGTLEGRPAGSNGQDYQATVNAPIFSPLEISVEWKALPQRLMYDILQIPSKRNDIKNFLEHPGFHDPPDYTAFFLTR